MKFKQFSIEDKQQIQEYYSKYGRIHCDSSFVANYCSLDRYKFEWCIEDGFLLQRFISDNNDLQYFEPMGDGDVTSIIRLLEEDAINNGTRLTICGVTHSFVSEMNKKYPGRWYFHSDRRYADYIYDISKLKCLKGKRYKTIRYKINHFAALYEFHYENLTPSIFKDCIDLENKWITKKRESISSYQLEKDIQDELVFIKRSFNNFKELQITGGALFVGDSLVAFAMGAPINESVFNLDITKGDTDYVGVYEMLIHQFVKHLGESFKYLDYEWDCGIDGLRNAKMNYHPEFLSEEIIGTMISNR